MASVNKSADWPTLGEEAAVTAPRKDIGEENNNVWNKDKLMEVSAKPIHVIKATEQSAAKETQAASSTLDPIPSSANQKPKTEQSLSNDRKRVNTKPKWSRFEEDSKSSSQKRRSDRGSDRYDDRPIRRGTGIGNGSTGASSSNSSSRYNSIRSSRSSQVSSKSSVNRGRHENGFYSSTQKSAQTIGERKTAKQLTGRPVVIDPMVTASSHFYGTYYYNNANTAYPVDVAVGSLNESIKRQM